MPCLKKMTDEQFAKYCGGLTAKIIYPFTITISILFTIGCVIGVDYSLQNIVCGYINLVTMVWSSWRRPNGRSLL